MKTKDQKYQEAIVRNIAYQQKKATAHFWSPESQKEMIRVLFYSLREADRSRLPELLEKQNITLVDSAKKYMMDMVCRKVPSTHRELTGVDFGIMPEPERV